jgi:hypothetical protein
MNKYLMDDRDFYLNRFKNIIKTDTGYKLQPVYAENNNHEIIKLTNCNDEKCCDICIYHNRIAEFNTCEIRNQIEPNLIKNAIIPCSWCNSCDAFTPVYPLNVINSEEEMIQFIEKTENFFGCVEEYEAYYGFERKWDEETGEVLETVREYYNRSGKFENIPDKYPCVIYFSYVNLMNVHCDNDDLLWIYIGEEKEK